MFVDTITFNFHYSTLAKCEEILENLDLVNYSANKYKDNFKIFRRFKIFDKASKFNICSYRSEISCQLRRVQGKAFDFYCIHFEFSIPKFYKNTNCFTFDCDLKEFFKDFIIYLNEQSGCDCSPVEIFICRIDCTASFLFSDREELKNCLDFFTPPRILQRKNKTQRYDTTLQFVSKYHMYKLYQKYDEMLENRDHHKLSDADFKKYSDLSRNIMRFEHEFKSAQLKRKLDLKRYDLITLDKFLASDFYKNFDIFSDIKEVFGDWTKEFKVYSREQAIELIDYSFSRKAKKYFSFLSKCFSCGIEEIKKTMSKQLYSHYKRNLRSIGIDIEKLCFFVENKIDTPFSDTEFFTKERLIFFDKN